MAVLKTFELDGNKLSFANWISNLSPTETPFTSMVGKERIDQVQYSWQTDSLAPATAEAYNEGSHATFEPRATTSVLTNFTSTIRKATSVSDTNECTHAYGRRDEMAYRMGKIGKELLRDIEYMNLATHSGRPGTASDSSRHAGFKALCAPLFTPDPDTLAITHQGIAIVDPKKPWFALKDIFRVTENLFLAGSKANKIMVHPKHMVIFSDVIGYNEETPLIYRLFEEADARFNMNVSKIRDTVGREYTIIPNRFMPDNQVYFFREEDWTQTVLREPSVKKLAKKGSSSQAMIEAEIGLKHKHPHASGVLHLLSVDYVAELAADKHKLTAFIPDQTNLHLDLHKLDTLPAANVDFRLINSDASVIELQTLADQTDASGQATNWVKPLKPGFATVYAFRDDVDHRLMSNPVMFEVVEPTVNWTLTGGNPQYFKQKTIRIDIKNAAGANVPNGTTVYFFCDEGQEKAGFIRASGTTTSGRVNMSIVPAFIGDLTFRIGFSDQPGEWRSKPYIVEVETNTIDIRFAPDTKFVLTQNIDGTQSVQFQVKDDGKPLANTDVIVTSSNEGVVKFTSGSYKTNADGHATTQMQVVGIGESTISGTCFGKAASMKVRVGTGSLSLVSDRNRIEYDDKAKITFTAQILDADGKPIKKSGVPIKWDELGTAKLEIDLADTQTDANGVCTKEATVKSHVGESITQAYWAQNDNEATAVVRIVPTQFECYFQPGDELILVAGVDTDIAPNAGIRHSISTVNLEAKEITVTSSNPAIVSVSPEKDHTDKIGFGNTILVNPVGVGSAILSNMGTETDLEKYTRATRKVKVVKPVASMACSDNWMVMPDEKGTLTITMQRPEEAGGGSLMYTGTATIRVDDPTGVEFDTVSVQFNNGIGNVDFTAKKRGDFKVTLTMPGNIDAATAGVGVISVKHPIIQMTTQHESIKLPSTNEFYAQLYKPDGKTKWAVDGKVVAFHSEPDTPAYNVTGRTIATNAGGLATLLSTPTQDGDVEVWATYNGATSNKVELKIEM